MLMEKTKKHLTSDGHEVVLTYGARLPEQSTATKEEFEKAAEHRIDYWAGVRDAQISSMTLEEVKRLKPQWFKTESSQ